MDTTLGARRRFLAPLALLMVGLLSLIACSSSGEDAGREEMIDFSYLDITAQVPANPERVVVMEGRGDLEFALLAGYNVVATGSGLAQDGTLPAEQFDGVVDPDTAVLSPTYPDPNYEEIIGLEPDLIVIRANAQRDDFYGNERLAEIAPVLPVEVNRANVREDTVAQLEILNRVENAQPYIDTYDETVADLKERLAPLMADKQIAMMTSQVADEGTIILWFNTLGTQVANDIGLDVMLRDTAGDEPHREISTENLGDIAGADVIFHQTTIPETLDPIAVWQNLPAVQRGHSYVLPVAYNNGLVITAAALANFLADSLSDFTEA